MAIPDFQTLMLPVLKASVAGEVKISDVVITIGSELGVTEAELSELLRSQNANVTELISPRSGNALCVHLPPVLTARPSADVLIISSA